MARTHHEPLRAGRWLAAVPMAALAIATVYPLVFTGNVAMKTRHEYVLDRFSPAEALRWDAFATAWSSADMDRYLANSLIVTASAVALLLLIGSMAGFALSQLRFRGSRALFLGCLAALFIPFQVIMVPLARTMGQTGLIDTYPGLILAYVAQFLPFTVFLMTSYYSGIPAEIIDAARMDGNSTYGVYGRAHRAAHDALGRAPHAHGRRHLAARPVRGGHPDVRRRGPHRGGAGPRPVPGVPAPDRLRRHRRFHEGMTCGSPVTAR
jgi:ABC-type glycerol-3-phosphate transport system permease component